MSEIKPEFARWLANAGERLRSASTARAAPANGPPWALARYLLMPSALSISTGSGTITMVPLLSAAF